MAPLAHCRPGGPQRCGTGVAPGESLCAPSTKAYFRPSPSLGITPHRHRPLASLSYNSAMPITPVYIPSRPSPERSNSSFCRGSTWRGREPGKCWLVFRFAISGQAKVEKFGVELELVSQVLQFLQLLAMAVGIESLRRIGRRQNYGERPGAPSLAANRSEEQSSRGLRALSELRGGTDTAFQNNSK